METRVAVPLRTGAGGKKMRKRKELDALGRRGRRLCSGGGVSSQDGLLSDSTDEPEPEEQWRVKRRSDGPSSRSWPRRRACLGVLRACTLVLVFACVVATTTVMWLFIDVREQATFLRNQLDQVVAGSQGVPEALQKCHSLSKQLQQNQTALFLKLNLLSTQLNNFTTQVTMISNRLNAVEQRFKTSPELIKVPHDLETLTTNIATFGSQMQDLVTTVGQLKEANSKLTETTKGVQSNITSLQRNISTMSFPPAASPAPSSVDIQGLEATINTVKANLSLVNDTLSKKIQWTLDDLVTERKQIEGLQERSENVSTRVTSLQNECSAKGAQLTSLASSVDQITSQVAKQDDHWTQMSSHVSELSAMCSQLQNNNTHLSNQLISLQKSLPSDNQTTIVTDSITTSPHPQSSIQRSFAISHVLVLLLGLCFILVFLCYWFV